MRFNALRTVLAMVPLVVLLPASVPLSLHASEDQQPSNVASAQSSHDEPIEISIKTLSGATIKVKAELSYTIAQLKETIQEFTGVASEAQQLVFNRALLKNEHKLCERNLGDGSIVFMVLFSEAFKNADDINQAFGTTTTSAGPATVYNAPIFREAPNEEEGQNKARTSICQDAHNWLFDRMFARDIADLFDPTVRLELTTAEYSKLSLAIEERDRKLRYGERADDVDGALRELRAQALIATKFVPHRKGFLRAERHGIRLGATWRREEPLIANINNYAPDNFTDVECLRLFELSEQVRQRLASDAQTGEGTLGLKRQREINQEVMRAYNQAMAGIPLAVDVERPDECGLCAICMESLELEPASGLACNHTLHTDCLREWIHHDLNRVGNGDKRARCPYCRKEFRPPYEGLKCSDLNSQTKL